MVLHETIWIILFEWLLFGFRISSYKSQKLEFIFLKSYHTNLNAKSCHDFALHTFRLVEPYKSFPLKPQLEILRNSSTIFRSSHRMCPIKKAFLNHFVIFTGKHLCWGLFLNKFSGYQSCNFTEKRPQPRYFLVNIRKFTISPILKNVSERLHFWKVFCQSIFQVRT